MAMHELDADDDYSSSGDPEERSIGPAVFNDTVGVLAPAEPVCLREIATVTEAAHRMLQARQAAGNFCQPVLALIGRQVPLLHMLQSGPGPLQGRLYIPVFVLIILRDLDMGIDMTRGGCLLPQADSLFKVSAPFLQDGQAPHCHAEV